MKHGPLICPLAPAHIAALAAYQCAVLLAFIDLRLAAVPLAVFLAACFAAPFFPGSQFYLPVIRRGKRIPAVALTFDDGPDPATTPRLLALLDHMKVRAAFFVTGMRAAQYPDLIREILKRGHAIGNHSYRHSPFLMFAGMARIREEIRATQEILSRLGATPLLFRPPAGITGPRLRRPLLEAGLACINWSRRGLDAGNRRIRNLAMRIARRASAGDIILLHDVAPRAGFNADLWLDEIERLIRILADKGLGISTLEELLGRPIMELSRETAVTAARAFYDSIASSYEAERTAALSRVFRKERELFETRLIPLVTPQGRVLEIGAGTGLFTIPIASRCREVTAVEISPSMAAQMSRRAAGEGLTNIRVILGDAEEADIGGLYDIICSFSSIEYIQDLHSFTRRLASHLAPGGLFFCTTAHSSPIRLFVQIGNAMRQGIWLISRGCSTMRQALAASGLVDIEVSTHVMRIPFFGGILLCAAARKPL